MISFSEAQLLAWINPILWPFIRTLALFAGMPVFSQRQVPARVRIGLALFIAVAAQPSLPAMPVIPLDSLPQILTVTAQQLLIGLSMGFAVRVVFAALEFAGEADRSADGAELRRLLRSVDGLARHVDITLPGLDGGVPVRRDQRSSDADQLPGRELPGLPGRRGPSASCGWPGGQGARSAGRRGRSSSPARKTWALDQGLISEMTVDQARRRHQPRKRDVDVRYGPSTDRRSRQFGLQTGLAGAQRRARPAAGPIGNLRRRLRSNEPGDHRHGRQRRLCRHRDGSASPCTRAGTGGTGIPGEQQRTGPGRRIGLIQAGYCASLKEIEGDRGRGILRRWQAEAAA